MNNVLYVIENGGDLWKITFPAFADITENTLAPSLAVYPNPFREASSLVFSNSGQEEHVLRMLDQQGRVVRTITGITGEQVLIDRGNLPSGLYFLRLNKGAELQQVSL